MSRTIYVTSEVYMSDIDEDDLIEELGRRGKKEIKNVLTIEDLEDIELVFRNSNEVLTLFKKCLGLREFHDKARIIKEIEQL